jgi:hypothetical protein
LQPIRILLGLVSGNPRIDDCAPAVLILSQLENLLHALFLGSLERLQVGDNRILILNLLGDLGHEILFALSVLFVVCAIFNHVVSAHLAVLFDHLGGELLIKLIESNTKSLDLAGCVPQGHRGRRLSHLFYFGHF